MADAAQSRVQSSMKSLVEMLDRTYLRKMEMRMHECAVTCCKDEDASMEKVHGCVARCQEETERAQRFIQNELQRYNEGLSRCVMQCQDDVKDKVKPDASEADVSKLRGVFEDCAIKCCDSNIAKVPNLQKRIEETLKMGRF